MDKSEYLKKVMRVFMFFWITTAIGVFVGQFIPKALMLPISILGIVLIIVSMFAHKRKSLSYGLYYLISFILGITAYSALAFYFTEMGPSIVLSVIISVVILFVILGMFGWRLNLDLTKFSTYLFVLLIVLIVVTIVAAFFPATSIFVTIVSAFGLFLFSLYTIYDFNRIAQSANESSDIPHDAFTIYINLFNMIMDALRLVFSILR